MTVTLGSITLSDHLVLTGLENAPAIAPRQLRTLAGYAVIQQGFNIGGRILALVSENHLDLDDVTAIRTLFALGQPVTLTHHRGTFVVLITGINVEPVTNYSDPDGAVWHSGEINLLEV